VITAKQEQAVSLLAGGASQLETARQIGVTRETVNRWCHDYTFSLALNDYSRRINSDATDILRSCIVDAAATLKDLLHRRKPDAIRLRAATTILQLANQQLALSLPAKVPSTQFDRNGERYKSVEEHEEEARRMNELGEKLMRYLEAKERASQKKPANLHLSSHRRASATSAIKVPVRS
jgi:hypothetical protein